MLSHNAPSKPRPTPPAKLRRARAPSLPVQPPPPYAPRIDMILDSPISVTAQLVGARSPAAMKRGQSLPPVEEWMTEKSRQELSNLLVAAGDIIKSRETELGLTSTLCKNLYEENFSLKSKHDAFLSRIPGRDVSPLPSPIRSLSPLPLGSSHVYGSSRPASPVDDSPNHSRHVRRISVTPGELSILADQNAELLGKLSKLEEESAEADLAGKRKLRKLEREIAGLRAELDKTREKGEELEQNLKKRGIGLTPEEEEEARRKREEREERLRLLREKNAPPPSASESSLLEIKDFAPASDWPRVRTMSNPKAPALNLATKPPPPVPAAIPEEGIHPNSAPASASDLTSYFPLSASASSIASVDSPQHAPPQLEYAIIAQLLAKVRELEEANVQITKEQKTAAERLQAAQRDADNIKRAYNVLAEGGEELQIIAEEEDDFSPSPTQHARVPTGSTIKFSSLRRSIELGGDLSNLASTEDAGELFASGITKQSTTRSSIDLGSPILQNGKGKVAGQKTRKSVVGLFDASPSAPLKGSQGAYPATLSVSPNFRALSPIPFLQATADMSTWSVAATDGLYEPVSPASSGSASPSPSVYSSPLLALTASTLDLVTSSSSLGPSSGQRPMHTLGSELGSDFGDDWGERAGNHHLRATSLYDMSAFVSRDASGPSDEAISNSPIVGPQIILPSPSTSPQSDSCWEDIDEYPPPPSSRTSGTELITPTKGRGSVDVGALQLQFVINPPTPTPNKYVRASPSSASLRGPPLGLSASTSALSLRESRSNRNLRLSQTVKARTSHWVERVERRYAESPPILDTSSQALVRRRRSIVGLEKKQRRTSSALDDTFELAVHQVSRSFSASSAEFQHLAEADELESAELGREVVVARASEQNLTGFEGKKQRDGFVGFILEVWLWLQFAIVVCVFLWAMARRGPKSVLEDAEKRRVEVQRRR